MRCCYTGHERNPQKATFFITEHRPPTHPRLANLSRLRHLEISSQLRAAQELNQT